MSTDLEGKLLKAKIELMTRSAFISTICLSVKHIITDKVPTAATSGTIVYYNPEFIGPLSIAELAGLMAHECWHVAFSHILRRCDRDPVVWNYAGDHVINLLLRKARFELPEGGLWDSQYEGMTTEEVYSDLMNDSNPPTNNPKNIMLDIQGDAGGSGNTLTNQLTPAQVQEQQSKISEILVRAQIQAQISGEKEAGNIPGEILRIIEKLTNPVLPWEQLLYQFLDARNKDSYSWSRRNRRHKSYLPSLYNEALGHLTFAIDTSGSVTDDELHKLLSELQGIRDVYNPERMTIIDCDSKINHVHEVTQETDIMSLSFTGGGGTRFQPVLDYVTENPTQALVYFTDLYGETNLDEVDYPILWICNSNHAPSNIGKTIYIDP